MSEQRYRPGVTHGPYPQKDQSTPKAILAWKANIDSNLKHLLQRQRFQIEYIVSKVNQYQVPYQQCSEVQLTEKISQLRNQLFRQGLTEPLIVESFAMLRETLGRTLGKRPYDCQLFGGWLMINGMLAQMATGEGKTLTAAITACTAALAGIPVHVVTANDYLAQRDAQLLKPLYDRLGLTSGAIQESLNPEQRHVIYAGQITHVSNKQLAFDYLRDRLSMAEESSKLRLQVKLLHTEQFGGPKLLLRGLSFAIIDEADNVLVDEAGTPLIISKTIDDPEEHEAYTGALYIATALMFNRDFSFKLDQRGINLTPEGQLRIAEHAKSLPKSWQSKPRREALISQALVAEHLYKQDQHYLVRDQKIVIIDEQTGRIMPDRSWEQGLHQMIEAKEGCSITPRRETLTRITYQRFFRRYLMLAGTSGTLTEVREELRQVYGLRTVTVPTHRALRRKMLPERLYVGESEKWLALVEQVKSIHDSGRPILIGTCSVAESEQVSKLLLMHELKHTVLNARQDQQEAEIIAQAGKLGAITVATNMAGRGTDIELDAGVVELGGLHVIAVMRNHERRNDRQLYGRCARQGDPGSAEAILSLQDEMFQKTYPKWLLKWLAGFTGNSKTFAQPIANWLIAYPQKKHASQQRQQRRLLVLQDQQNEKITAFSARQE